MTIAEIPRLSALEREFVVIDNLWTINRKRVWIKFVASTELVNHKSGEGLIELLIEKAGDKIKSDIALAREAGDEVEMKIITSKELQKILFC